VRVATDDLQHSPRTKSRRSIVEPHLRFACGMLAPNLNGDNAGKVPSFCWKDRDEEQNYRNVRGDAIQRRVPQPSRQRRVGNQVHVIATRINLVATYLRRVPHPSRQGRVGNQANGRGAKYAYPQRLFPQRLFLKFTSRAPPSPTAPSASTPPIFHTSVRSTAPPASPRSLPASPKPDRGSRR